VGLSYARRPIRVLGVDPGLTRCGVGVVEGAPGRALTMIRVGVIRTAADQDIATRLLAIETGADPQLEPFVAKGRELFMRRQGQLNLGCANCHDDNWDKRLAGSAITQGHPTGYPLYRLEWQSLGSLQRRLRSCISGVRAQGYDYGAPELVELELYLMTRARGMPIETPAVRP